MKKLKKILFVMIGFLGLMGCGESSSGSSPSLTEEELIIAEVEMGHQKSAFLLTDAPSDNFKSVRVDIVSPLVATTDKGDINIPLPDGLPIRVDLLALNGVSDLLTSQVIPTGTLQKITLTLANPEIVLLDDTVLDASKIEFTRVLTTTPTQIAVFENQGKTIEIDIDVEKSVQFDPTKGTLIFKPQGNVRHLGAADSGIEVREIAGTVVAVPGIKEQPDSFLLRHPERRFFIPVNADGAIIYNPDETKFGAIAKDQYVRVSGFFTADGVLKARRVLIVPENHRVLRGIITNLATSTLTLIGAMDSSASGTIVYNIDTTPIRLERHDTILKRDDLTNGQVVSVHGRIRPEGRFEARVIILHLEKFLGFIAREKDCLASPPRFHLFYPPRLAHRLHLAGIKDVNRIGVVEIGGKIVSLQGEDMTCDVLRHGMAVHIFGYMMPPLSNDPLPLHVKALEGREAMPIVGEIVNIADNKMSFTMKARRADIRDSACTNVDEVCFVKIKVVLSPPVLRESVNLLQVNKKVYVVGFFESIRSLTTVREFFLQAVLIKEYVF